MVDSVDAHVGMVEARQPNGRLIGGIGLVDNIVLIGNAFIHAGDIGNLVYDFQR